MNKEKTCKDCTYCMPYEGSDDRFAMECRRYNYKIPYKDEKTCWRFKLKEKSCEINTNCGTDTEHKTSCEPQTQKKSIKGKSCYECNGYTIKDDKDFCILYEKDIKYPSTSRNCFFKISKPKTKEPKENSTSGTSDEIFYRCIHPYETCDNCLHARNNNGNWFCQHFYIHLITEDMYYNEDCSSFEAKTPQLKEDQDQVSDNETSQLKSEHIKELQEASNLLLDFDKLLVLQDHYKHLQCANLKIPKSVIYTNNGMGNTFYFDVDPIDTVQFLKEQLKKQGTLLRNKIDAINDKGD